MIVIFCGVLAIYYDKGSSVCLFHSTLENFHFFMRKCGHVGMVSSY